MFAHVCTHVHNFSPDFYMSFGCGVACQTAKKHVFLAKRPFWTGSKPLKTSPYVGQNSSLPKRGLQGPLKGGVVTKQYSLVDLQEGGRTWP